MQCRIAAENDQISIALSGLMTFSDSTAFVKVLEQVKTSAAQSCLIDLSELEFIDSTGLRMLLLIHDLCRDSDIKLSFKGATGRVHEMLLQCRFETIVTIVD